MTGEQPEAVTQPFQGVRVIELGRDIAGPYCAKLLADFGADVLKIEPPGAGDPSRRAGPFPQNLPNPEASGLFLYLNTNKRSLTLDPGTATGRTLLAELLAKADVLVENYPPGSLEGWGLAADALLQRNPKLVVTRISSFGQQGPYRDYQATELTLYALGGMQYITGAYDREPVKHGYHQAQYVAGVNAAGATVAALLDTWATGEGHVADISIMEAVASTLFSTIVEYSYVGLVERREPRKGSNLRHPMPTRDGGYILPSPGVMGDWETYARMLGIPELLEERFSTPGNRAVHADELDDILRPAFKEKAKDEWFHQAQEWRFPFAPVQSAQDIYHCPQLEARGFFVESEHPAAGRVRMPGALVKLSESPRQHRRPAPLLGQHTAEVISGELGYSREELARLRAAGVV
ncbi:MAG: CoA transferase [Chloroflexi bacterium]|nr:CoA transferase [Chloroflexota bacterium]